MEENKAGRPKRFFLNHAKSSAAVISLAIHAGLLLAAVSFVAVRIIVREEPVFDARKITRPKLELRKLQVPVDVKKKKTQAPKLRKRIVVQPTIKRADFKMPEVAGIKGGMGYLDQAGGIGSLGFGLELNLFGGDKGSGNELEGTFFDLKLDKDGKPTSMNPKAKGMTLSDADLLRDNNLLDMYDEAVRNFLNSWSVSRLDRYFKAPTKRFTTTFMFPHMPAADAPKAFKVEDVVQPRQWVAYYSGKIAAPVSGQYRFWGIADDLMMIRIDGDLVIDASLSSRKFTEWDSADPRSRKHPVGTKERGLVIGDWFRLKANDPVTMEVLIGERPGGVFYCRLLIEQEGVEYQKLPDGRPLLPIFKTVGTIPPELVEKMDIPPDTCTVDGPSFGALK